MTSRTTWLTAGCLVLLLAAGGSAHGMQEYLIGGGDVLEINVWKNAELSRRVTVRPDGRITLPLVRDIEAGGQTAVELGRLVAEQLAAFVNAPNVTVTVVEAHSCRVYTRGAVTNAAFPLATPLNAMQLLAQAGGGTAEADLRRAFLLRGGKRLPTNLEIPPEGGQPGDPYPELLPGDVLVVPAREASRRVLVIGEVQHPVTMPYVEGLTVLDAFVEAGGGNDFSDLASVLVARLQPGGKHAEVRVDLERVLKRGDLSQNIRLAPGDVVVVPR